MARLRLGSAAVICQRSVWNQWSDIRGHGVVVVVFTRVRPGRQDPIFSHQDRRRDEQLSALGGVDAGPVAAAVAVWAS